MTSSDQDRPDYRRMMAGQRARHRRGRALIAAAEAELEAARANQLSPWEVAARIFEQHPWDCPQPPNPWDRPQTDQEP